MSSPSQTDLGPPGYAVHLDRQEHESLSFEKLYFSGWAAYFSDALARFGDPFVYVRCARQGHSNPAAEEWRLEPFEIRNVRCEVRSGNDLGSIVRSLPFRRIEAGINRPSHREHLAEWLPGSIMPADVVGSPIYTSGELGWLMRPGPETGPRPRATIKVPAGARRPDSFYALVAERYLWVASVSNAPADDFAKANEVPTSTVHRWVREAKARGLLLLPKRRGEA